MSTIISRETALHYLWGHNCNGWTLTYSNDLTVNQEAMPAGTKE
ncbi:MAG TPA: hypothetical protein VKI61_06640 [Chitinophagaceae bacterium]|nr:hypothetical protein [Chitinophagaceae bacterium]